MGASQLDFLPDRGATFEDWTPQARAIKAAMLRIDTIDLCAMFFPEMEGSIFKVSHHHRVMANTLDRVFAGEISRLVINIPPGYTKTLMTMIAFMARGFAINPRCRFLHVSTSDSLVRENSSYVKNIVSHPWFQSMFPMPISTDSGAKNHWKTQAGGELLAVSTRGRVIGFRAGRPDHSPTNFTGAILVDDPIKPLDALSPVVRAAANSAMNHSIKTRLMKEDVPIIIIMQRVHENDTTDYVLSGGTGEPWHWLVMKALSDTGRPPPVPKRYAKHAIMVDYEIPTGPLWEFKHNHDQLMSIKDARTDEDEDSGMYVWNAQYQQEPASIKNGMFQRSWFGRYDALPSNLTHHIIVMDTASKDGEANDWSVMLCAAVGFNENNEKCLYLIDLHREKLLFPALILKAKAFWEKLKTVWTEDEKGSEIQMSGASLIKIEDKASGTGLIQSLLSDGFPARGIQRSISKIERSLPCLAPAQSGRILLPSKPNKNTTALWVEPFLDEVCEFNEMMTHKYDDQCDVFFDAVSELMLSKGEIKTSRIGGLY